VSSVTAGPVVDPAPDEPCVLPEEQRYPLDLTSRLADVRRLYEEAARDRWDPEDVDLSTVGTGVSEPARRAGALVWSHRAWLAYRGIAESEAALVRLCVERDREVDAKYLLTARGADKALAAEAGWLVAERLGGYVDGPGDSALSGLLRDRVARRLLHAGVDPDGVVVAQFVLSDSIELALWRASRAVTTQPALVALIDRLAGATERHVAFGWAYAAARLPAVVADPVRRRAVEEAAAAVLVAERAGRRVAHRLADGTAASAALADAVDVAAAAGHGTAPGVVLVDAMEAAIADVAARLSALGITIPPEIP
jgi:hypothetical protein